MNISYVIQFGNGAEVWEVRNVCQTSEFGLYYFIIMKNSVWEKCHVPMEICYTTVYSSSIMNRI